MPLERFSDFEAARRALWVERGDPQLAPRIRKLWSFAHRLTPPCYPRGLHKFSTIEVANLDREAWVARRIRKLRAARQRP